VFGLSRLRAAARFVAVIGLVATCGSGATARSVPASQVFLYNATDISAERPSQLTERGPFGLIASKDSPLAARWRALQPMIDVEMGILAACRSDPAICPAAAARFLAVVEAARGLSGLARLGEINRGVNLAIRSMNDIAQFGIKDLWATPLMTFASGAGDCEDYAIAKYFALRQAGIADSDLRLVIVHERQLNQDHAVVAARTDGRWLILDNRTMILRADTEVRDMTPLLALNNANEDHLPMLVAASR
jgi:predicted transglutaminase-like cysteine proteinase